MNSSRSQTFKRLYRNMLSSLILSGRVSTTQRKAKILKSEAQGLLAKLEKIEDKTSRLRFLKEILYGGAVEKAVSDIKPGTKVRIFDHKNRVGDGSLQSLVVLESPKVEKKVEKTVKDKK